MTLGWKVKWKSYLTLCNPWTVGSSGLPLSMESSRQEYWSRLPFPSPGKPSCPGIEPVQPLQVDSLPSEPPGKPWTRQWPWGYNIKSTSNKRNRHAGLHQTCRICASDDTSRNRKDGPPNGRKYFQSIYLIRNWYPECKKNPYNYNFSNNPTKNWQKI